MESSFKERLQKRFAELIKDIRKAWQTYEEDKAKDLQKFEEMASDFYPVYISGVVVFRWQLSGGGPADWFDFYVDPLYNLIFVEYHYSEWGKESKRKVSASRFKLLREIWEYYFVEIAKNIKL